MPPQIGFGKVGAGHGETLVSAPQVLGNRLEELVDLLDADCIEHGIKDFGAEFGMYGWTNGGLYLDTLCYLPTR